MKKELDLLRIDAIQAVYHSSVSTHGKCLTENHIKRIKNCMDDTN